jgi:hypothetical protein
MATNKLRSLFQAREFVAAPGVFALVSAKLADLTNAKALYMTGFGTVASYLGSKLIVPADRSRLPGRGSNPCLAPSERRGPSACL